MGSRGPVPKRDSQRRRQNKPEVETTTAEGAAEFEPPKANSRWPAIVKRWFDSLAQSGQAQFYQPSDWSAAELLADAMARDFKGQEPISGARLQTYLSGMSSLLVTEGDRRRVRLELERPTATADEVVSDEFSERRRRRLQSG